MDNIKTTHIVFCKQCWQCINSLQMEHDFNDFLPNWLRNGNFDNMWLIINLSYLSWGPMKKVIRSNIAASRAMRGSLEGDAKQTISQWLNLICVFYLNDVKMLICRWKTRINKRERR